MLIRIELYHTLLPLNLFNKKLVLKCHSLEHKQHDPGWYGKCICHKYICFFFVGGLTADASYKDWSALYIARKIFAVLRIISNYTFISSTNFSAHLKFTIIYTKNEIYDESNLYFRLYELKLGMIRCNQRQNKSWDNV